MYLSRLIVDSRTKEGQKILADLYRQHRMVMGGFKDYDSQELGRVLFRLEPESKEVVFLLVQSQKEPDWSHLESFVHTETKRFDLSLPKGIYRFRLRANPVVTRDKKRYGLVGEKDQRAWLLKKETGFEWQDFRIIDEGHLIMTKNGKRVFYKSVRFEGLAQVNDPKKALMTINEGIGPAKGFGFGLLSLAKA